MLEEIQRDELLKKAREAETTAQVWLSMSNSELRTG
jgi:hypothetical protein